MIAGHPGLEDKCSFSFFKGTLGNQHNWPPNSGVSVISLEAAFKVLSTLLRASPSQPVKSMPERDLGQKPGSPSVGRTMTAGSASSSREGMKGQVRNPQAPTCFLRSLSPGSVSPAPPPADAVFLRTPQELLTAEQNRSRLFLAHFPHLFYPTTVIFGFLFRILLFILQGVKMGEGAVDHSSIRELWSQLAPSTNTHPFLILPQVLNWRGSSILLPAPQNLFSQASLLSPIPCVVSTLEQCGVWPPRRSAGL